MKWNVTKWMVMRRGCWMKGVRRIQLVNNIDGWLVSCEKFKDETVTDRNHGRDSGQVLMVSNTYNLKVGVYQHIVCFNFNVMQILVRLEGWVCIEKYDITLSDRNGFGDFFISSKNKLFQLWEENVGLNWEYKSKILEDRRTCGSYILNN